MSDKRVINIARVILRFALGITFLVSVADRFGLLGPYGTRNVSWGDWSHFREYVAVLNWFLPKALIPVLAVIETGVETTLGIGLLLGVYQRVVAWSSAALLASFALTMSFSLGVVAPVSWSVFTATGAALLLGATTTRKSQPDFTRQEPPI